MIVPTETVAVKMQSILDGSMFNEISAYLRLMTPTLLQAYLDSKGKSTGKI